MFEQKKKKFLLFYTNLFTRSKNKLLKDYLSGIIDILNSKNYINSIVSDFNFFSNTIKNIEKKKVLDYGCGAGFQKIFFNKYFGVEKIIKWNDQNYNVNDYNLIFSLIFTELNKHFKKKNFFLFSNKLFTKNTFDVIYLSAVLEHIDDKDLDDSINFLKKVLKDDGYILISKLPNKYSYQEFLARIFKLSHHSNLYDFSKINAFCKKYKFKIVDYELCDFFFFHPNKIFNPFSQIFFFIEKILNFISKRNIFIAHNYRLILKKM